MTTPATNATMTNAPAAFREKPMSETPMLFAGSQPTSIRRMSGCGVQSELLCEHGGVLCVRVLTLTALSVGLGELDPDYRRRRSRLLAHMSQLAARAATFYPGYKYKRISRVSVVSWIA